MLEQRVCQHTQPGEKGKSLVCICLLFLLLLSGVNVKVQEFSILRLWVLMLTFPRFLNTAVGSTVVENWFPLINPVKRRFMYKPG